MIIQLCKDLSTNLKFVLFVNNFFTNSKLFKALKTLNNEACETAKSGNNYFKKLLEIWMTATEQKNWGKIDLMTTKINKKTNIKNDDILCMTWVDLNTVQLMTIIHIINEMKSEIYKSHQRRRGIFKSVICFNNRLYRTSALFVYTTKCNRSSQFFSLK